MVLKGALAHQTLDNITAVLISFENFRHEIRKPVPVPAHASFVPASRLALRENGRTRSKDARPNRDEELKKTMPRIKRGMLASHATQPRGKEEGSQKNLKSVPWNPTNTQLYASAIKHSDLDAEHQLRRLIKVPQGPSRTKAAARSFASQSCANS
jgi:hypothetical protein